MKKRQFTKITDFQIELFKEYLSRIERFGFSGVVLLARKDEIIINQGYGYQNFEERISMKSTSALSIGSISKQFTSTMIMNAVQDGKIFLADVLGKFFTNTPNDKNEITIHQLLTHTSGIADDFGDDFEYIEEGKFIQQVLSSPLGSKPGEMFKYSNHGYSFLGIILQQIEGKSYQNLLLDNYFLPLGINHVGWFGDPKWTSENSTSYYLDGENTGSVGSWKGSWEKPYWAILANGGVCLPAIELYHWVKSVITGKVLNDNSLTQLFTPEKNDYAYGWNVLDSRFGKLISHDGGNDIGVSAVCHYYTDQDIMLIIQSNLIQNGFGMAMQAEEMWGNILDNSNMVLPPLIESQNQTVSLDPKTVLTLTSNEENYLTIATNKIGHQTINVTGQKLLNAIFKIEDARIQYFEDANRISREVGAAFMRKDWVAAFNHFKDKTVSERRIGFITEMIQMFESKYGKINRMTCSGTIPYKDYYAMSLLRIIGENGSSGVPLIWENEITLLGFRPMFTEYPLTLSSVSNDMEIKAVSFTDPISFTLTWMDNSHYTLVTENEVIELINS